MGPFCFKEIIIFITPAETHCIAQAIYAEARGESFDGKRAVAHVIINRSEKLGKNPCVIIKQPGQFKYKTGIGKQWSDALRAAKELGNDLTNGALYFKTHSSRIHWPYKLTVRIGGHGFYK